MIELKPCPCCGANGCDVNTFRKRSHSGETWVRCARCGCQAPFANWNTRASEREAIADWLEKLPKVRWPKAKELAECIRAGLFEGGERVDART